MDEVFGTHSLKSVVLRPVPEGTFAALRLTKARLTDWPPRSSELKLILYRSELTCSVVWEGPGMPFPRRLPSGQSKSRWTLQPPLCPAPLLTWNVIWAARRGI